MTKRGCFMAIACAILAALIGGVIGGLTALLMPALAWYAGLSVAGGVFVLLCICWACGGPRPEVGNE